MKILWSLSQNIKNTMDGWKYEWNRFACVWYNESCSCGDCGGVSAATCKCARKRFKRAWKAKHNNVPELSERVKTLEDAVLKK
jgi:hypothetical protein